MKSRTECIKWCEALVKTAASPDIEEYFQSIISYLERDDQEIGFLKMMEKQLTTDMSEADLGRIVARILH